MSDRGSYFFDPINHDHEWLWLTFLQVIVKWSAIIAFAKIPNNANHSFANYPNSHYFDGFLFWEWKKTCKFIKMIGNCVIHWEMEKIFSKKVRKFLKNKIINYFFFLFAYICDRKMIADHSWMIVDHIFWEPRMSDRGSYFFKISDHDREWSWLMKKMIVGNSASREQIVN